MCGICGYVSKYYIEPDTLRKMNDTLYHRGPDDGGVEVWPMQDGYTIGMAQRRLSILDLSASGHQPMSSNDGRVSIVFNGEIYNFKELREQLSYEFQSSCDTEVILAAYLKWGIQCLEKLNGMFAICIYDRKTQEVFLARDRIGKKPLYYWYQDGNLVFASELKPIMECPGFEKKIRTDILARYLCYQYILAPDSIFENVYKLEPGAVLKFHGGKIESWKYWDVSKVYNSQIVNPVKDYPQAKEQLKQILKKAVQDRLVADVPVGTFLSGGYDSSLVSAMAADCSETPVKTYCIGFHEKEYNEAQYAKEIARHLGTKHTELYIGEEEMLELIDSIPEYYDEPFADSSQIPTMLVSKLAKQEVTVALSGDGGDEFFCGYNIYEKVHQAQQLDWAGSIVHGLCNIPGVRALNLNDKLPTKAKIIAANRNSQTKTQFAVQHYMKDVQKLINPDFAQKECLYEFEKKYGAKDWQVRRMLLDMETYLPDDILCKVDRASMKYSLETRCPILDTAVMEFSYRIPQEYKYHNGIKKYILKELTYDYIPKELLERPKKGFSVPISKWLRDNLREQLLDYCSEEYLRKQGIFDKDVVTKLVGNYLNSKDQGPMSGANYSPFVWAFFVFQMWYEKWI